MAGLQEIEYKGMGRRSVSLQELAVSEPAAPAPAQAAPNVLALKGYVGFLRTAWRSRSKAVSTYYAPRLEQLHTQLERVRREAWCLRVLVEVDQEVVGRCGRDLAALRQTNACLNTQLTNSLHENEQVKTALEAAQLRADLAEAAAEEKRAAAEQLAGQVAALAQELAQERSQSQALRLQLQESLDQVEELEEGLAGGAAELAAQETRVTELERELASLKEQMCRLEETARGLEETEKAAMESRQALLGSLAHHQAALRQAQSQAKLLKQEAEELSGKLDAACSWRQRALKTAASLLILPLSLFHEIHRPLA